MSALVTESAHQYAEGLEDLPDSVILQHLLAGQIAALEVVRTSHTAISRAADAMADAIRAGRILHYAAAGSSALMAVSDGLELEGTFGIDRSQVQLWMAGGIPTQAGMPGDVEDDVNEAARVADSIVAGDVVLLITASGRTPYTRTIARLAHDKGAVCIAVANVAGAEIFSDADIPVCLPTPPEVIAGSTRLGAATAQKAALNMMSTLMGIRLGHVYDGKMINLLADNEKLHGRAMAMVSEITGVGQDDAGRYLAAAQGDVKQAVLLAMGIPTLSEAAKILRGARGNLRMALHDIGPEYRAGPENRKNDQPKGD